MTRKQWLKLFKSGSLWGGISSIAGAMMGPPVLAVLPTKWAGGMIVVGTLITVISRSLPNVVLDMMGEEPTE